MNDKEKREISETLNRELETMTLEDLQNFYFDRRWDELVIEKGLLDARLEWKNRPYGRRTH